MHVVRKKASLLLSGAIACTLLVACHGSPTITAPNATPPTVDFSCVPTPTVPATSPPTSIPLSVTCTGTAASASGVTPTYSWNFGDGNTTVATITTAQATYTYAAPGTYTVTLTATAGNSANRIEQVTVTGGPPVSTESWAWASGSRYANSFGTFQTEYTPSPANQPSARQGAANWTDAQGRLWLFGGSGHDSNGSAGGLNDLWRFDPAPNSASNPGGGEWTWVNGSNKANAWGVYGDSNNIGKPSVGAVIGARTSAAHWTDAQGNFWLFGGSGIDSTGTQGYLNDMWMVSPQTGQPIWYGGASTVNSTGSATMPGARAFATTWTDRNGMLWLFGGQTINTSGTAVTYNDLWSFDPVAHQWTLVSAAGSATPGNAKGAYGTKGSGSTLNLPGARLGALGWTDTAGTLWLFGGSGYDLSGASGVLNDMWSFVPSSGQWTWVSGLQTAGAPGVYPATADIGKAGPTYLPSSRVGAVGWTDPATGRLWLFGGGGFDSSGVSTTSTGGGDLNDLWSFNPTSGQWAWMGGPSVAGGAGIFTPAEISSPLTYSNSNTPGARIWSTGWVDANGKFWLFGGSGIDAELVNGTLNDLWTIQLTKPAP